MRALQKDIFREIKKSKSRFLSIVAIIALGICFFVGIKATGPSMAYTADQYYQNQNLMDFRLVSTYGFQDEDIQAIVDTDGVASVMPGYSADVIIDHGEYRPVIRLYSVPQTQNQLVLVEGRLPEKSGEIAIEAPFEDQVVEQLGFGIGDTITLDPDLAGTPRSDTVSPDTFTIVGTVRSPQYVSFDRGTTAVGNGNVAYYGFIPESDFGYERYTEVYVRSEASVQGKSAFSEDYWTTIEAFQSDLEKVGADRLEVNYTEIMNEAQKALDEGRDKYNEGQQEFLEGIASGEIELQDAYDSLVSGELEYQSGVDELYNTMATTQAQLDQSAWELEAGRQELIQGEQELEQRVAEAEVQLDEGRAGMVQLSEAIAQMEAADPSDQLPELEAQLEAVKEQIAEGEAGIAEIQAGIAALNEQIVLLEAQIEALDPEAPDYETEKAALEAQKGALETEITVLEAQIEAIETGLVPAYGAKEELEAGIAEILSFQQQLDDLKVQLAALEQQVADGEAALETEVAAAKEQLNSGWNEYYAGVAQYEQGKAQFEAGVNEGWAQLNAAQAQLSEGWSQYYEGQAQLEESRVEGQAELDQAAQELADAEKEISEIEKGKWYFFDREENPGYRSYGEDAQRINNIANVFPLFFLLVAALVSFTTMTRMVEEQRTQIGTLKALGYKPYQIAMKFIVYAVMAGAIGALIGMVVGLNTLPYLIAGAYGMMYQVPELIIAPPWLPIIISCLIAVLCTVLAAVLATYMELREQPSELMRPKAPKIGKNILLERIPFIWRRLGFIEKVTARNLMRYKGRFFMTVVGIAGCTALILAGFGLQDAIMTIIPRQFEEIAVYDGLMAFKEGGTLEQKADIKNDLNNDARFTENMLAYQTSMKIEKSGEDYSKSVYLLVPETVGMLDDYIHLRNLDTQEAIDLADSGVVITEKAARDLGLSIGDTARVFNDDEAYEVTIGGITENYIENYLYLTPEIYEEIVGKPIEYNVAYVNIDGSNEALETEIANEWLEKDDLVSMNFTGSIIESSENSMGSLNIVILVLILSAGALAGVVLYNLTNINISERVREIATIRVLGFYDMEVYNYIFRENIVLSLIGVLVGLFLGTGLDSLIINTMETDMTTFVREIEWSSYLFAALLTMAFTLIINFVMTPIIKRINMVESLKSIE